MDDMSDWRRATRANISLCGAEIHRDMKWTGHVARQKQTRQDQITILRDQPVRNRTPAPTFVTHLWECLASNGYHYTSCRVLVPGSLVTTV